MAEGSSKRITISVKTPKEKKDIEIDEDSSVETVRKSEKSYLSLRLINLRVKNMKSAVVRLFSAFLNQSRGYYCEISEQMR